MNIREAKEELVHTVRAYTAKDQRGFYKIPGVRQRPVLLIGPPGIGKTAIMEQVAELCGVGLASYTMTHHTRQSAVGLPMIQKQMYDGREYAVTEYTMSEIIASMYQMMELTGKKEGILFLDEINCVSETLAPTMLQFLQNKTFGSHRIPEGWIIVAAGNPAEYNKSVREFDVVTLDRVRRLSIEPDVDVWMEYAVEKELHGAVLSYLNWKGEHFYHIRKHADGMEFVTARGWEDLSVILKEYEELEIPVQEYTILEYLQTERIARDFYGFYQMFHSVNQKWRLEELLDGREWKERNIDADELRSLPVDERFCLVQLLSSGMNRVLKQWFELLQEQKQREGLMKKLEGFAAQNAELEVKESLSEFLKRERHSLEVRRSAGILKEQELREEETKIQMIESWGYLFGQYLPVNWSDGKQILEKEQETLRKKRRSCREDAEKTLKQMVFFLEQGFGKGAELVYFLTGILKNPAGSEFLQEEPPEFLQKYSDLMLLDQEEKRLRKMLSE